MSDPQKKLRLRESAVFRAIDDKEGALLDVKSRSFFSLNPTGLFILEQIEAGSTRDQILAELCDHFATEPEDCAADLDRFLDELRAAELLEQG